MWRSREEMRRFMDKKLCRTGYAAFFLSGLCSISSGVIVSILQEKYGFSYGVTGTLLSFMSIGNMAASFASGILPNKIGAKNTVVLLCSGYMIGYFLMTLSGVVGLLTGAFLLVGIAKGCAINNCTILVGNNCEDRTKGMSLMHACYAGGALLCPVVIALLLKGGNTLPMIGIAALGLIFWLIFLAAKIPEQGKDQNGQKRRGGFAFLKSKTFWILTGLVFCQNAAETSVAGWLVTYYKDQGILSGMLSNYTVTIMWGATLAGRLLIAFVFPVKNTYRSLAVMGIGCTVLYGALMLAASPIPATLMLFGFAFAMAGVNPVAVAGVGKEMSVESMGIMLPVAGIGAILMPWVIGIVADSVSLSAGMLSNLIPCAGIFLLSFLMMYLKRKEK